MRIVSHALLALFSIGLLQTKSLQAETLTALVDLPGPGQGIYVFDSATPANGSTFALFGVPAGQSIIAIDFRPATGQLYGLSSASSIHTIGNFGSTSLVGSGFATQLTGNQYGFDFNPVIDRIRIVGDSDQNIVANPNDGQANIAATTPVFYAAGDANNGVNPNVVHHAYTNNVLFGTAASTQLYAIDSSLDILTTQANNAGTLATVGSLGVDAGEVGGFDISFTGLAYAAFSEGGTSNLYTVDLNTGAATNFGSLPFTVRGLAATSLVAVAVPEPGAGLALVGLLGTALLKRRKRS